MGAAELQRVFVQPIEQTFQQLSASKCRMKKMYLYLLGFAICSLAMAQPGLQQKKSVPATKAPVVTAPKTPALVAPVTSGSGIFNQAPPLVNKALIANVAKFYQLQVDGKFRQCIPLVADSSQDDYFNAQKSKYREFEILKVDYKDNFKKAIVTLTVGITYVFHGEAVPLKAPIASTWKLEKGQWKWYVDKENVLATPFGGFKAGPGDPESKLVTRPQSAGDVIAQVKMDKQDIMLSSFADSKDEILITNNMQGVVSLMLDYETLPGLSILLEKSELKAGEKARIMIAYHPSDKSPKPMRRGLVKVEQTGAYMPFNIVFAVTEEVMKLIPAAAK